MELSRISGFPLERVLKMASRGFGQTPEHDANHANPNHGLAMIHAHFIVAAKAPGFVEPPESSLYDPALGKNLETFGAVTAANDLQAQFPKGAQLLNPLHQCAQVAAIGPDELQAAKHADQELD